MTISVEGQFFLSFNLEGEKDFIDVEDLIDLTTYEYAGNILPTFELEFTSTNSNILKLLNEGNSIKIQVGKSIDESEDVILFPSTLSTTKNGATGRYYKVAGFASSIGYITNHTVGISAAKSAVEMVTEVAVRNEFKTVSNIVKSDDSQKWIQCNTSDRQFLNDVLMRADLGTSFPVFAITLDGSFICHDLEKLIESKANNKHDWRFSKVPLKENDIVYDTDVEIESKAGFINSWIGYGKELKVIDSVAGTVNTVFEEPKIIMSMSKELDKSKDINARFGGSRFISDNVASTYWSSYNHNLQSLANLSKIDNTLSFTNFYYPVKPLDIAMFYEESNIGNNYSGEEQSGLYIVSGVVKTFQAKTMSTVIILNREAFNGVKNAN
jgi:hypothetical protein